MEITASMLARYILTECVGTEEVSEEFLSDAIAEITMEPERYTD